jgi:hypothetical protein
MVAGKQGTTPMKFTHPLARDAKIWTASAQDGSARRVLAIVTTLALDPESKRYKKDKVERLSADAKDFVSAHPAEADAFLLMNRVKDWHSSRA